jgi:hypothetical protein
MSTSKRTNRTPADKEDAQPLPSDLERSSIWATAVAWIPPLLAAIDAGHAQDVAIQERFRATPESAHPSIKQEHLGFLNSYAHWLLARFAEVWRTNPGLPAGTLETALSNAITTGKWADAVDYLVQHASAALATDRSFAIETVEDIRELFPHRYGLPALDMSERPPGLAAPQDANAPAASVSSHFPPWHPGIVVHVWRQPSPEELSKLTQAVRQAVAEIAPLVQPRPGARDRGRQTVFVRKLALFRVWREWCMRRQRLAKLPTTAAFARQEDWESLLVDLETVLSVYNADWIDSTRSWLTNLTERSIERYLQGVQTKSVPIWMDEPIPTWMKKLADPTVPDTWVPDWHEKTLKESQIVRNN